MPVTWIMGWLGRGGDAASSAISRLVPLKLSSAQGEGHATAFLESSDLREAEYPRSECVACLTRSQWGFPC